MTGGREEVSGKSEAVVCGEGKARQAFTSILRVITTSIMCICIYVYILKLYQKREERKENNSLFSSSLSFSISRKRDGHYSRIPFHNTQDQELWADGREGVCAILAFLLPMKACKRKHN